MKNWEGLIIAVIVVVVALVIYSAWVKPRVPEW